MIDGTTQPGYGGTPIIELDGSAITSGLTWGLRLGTACFLHSEAQIGLPHIVQGLVINRFNGPGLRIVCRGGFTIQNNYIGTDVTGTQALGNTREGILLDTNHDGPSIIGGMSPSERNVISGNGRMGIFAALSNDNRIQGNYIGTDASGTKALGNAQGVEVNGHRNIIGGTAPGAGNLISGNLGDGIGLFNAQDNRIQGNLIGTQVDGISPLGNGREGVSIHAENTVVGGTAAGEPNTIAFNGAAGVAVRAHTGNLISANAIHDNAALGIDLLIGIARVVNVNDAGDADTGSNDLQNYPVLTDATATVSGLHIGGTLHSTADRSFALQFFANHACDSSGHGEGERYLGTVDVTTVGTVAAFDVTLPYPPGAGTVVTATSTDASRNTSEFSGCRPVTMTPATSSVRKVTVPAGSEAGWSFTLTGPGTPPGGETAVTTGGAAVPFSTPLQTGSYVITESARPGYDQTDAAGCTFTVAYPVDAGRAFGCTVTNTERATLIVTKTQNQSSQLTQGFDFTLQGEGVSRSMTANSTNAGVLDFTSAANGGPVRPGTYRLCEGPLPGGYASTLGPIDAATGLACATISLQSGQAAHVHVDNTTAAAGAQPHTIGYWRNWNQCSGGSQAAVALRNGYRLLESFLPVNLGPAVVVTTCPEAVAILSSPSMKFAEHGLAAQLLAAKLNLASGSESCPAAADATAAADNLLIAAGWSGALNSSVVGTSHPLRTQYVATAAALDRYNNGLAC